MDCETIRKCRQFSNSIQRNFADCEFGPTKAQKFSVVLVEENDSSYWFVQVGQLYHLSTHSALHDAHELAFFQYLELTPPVDKVGRILN